MAVRVDTSGVSATKVRPTEERAHIPKTIYCLLVYKCLNVYTYTLSAYLPVGRSVRPSIYASITPSTLISYHLYINDFQLVLLVNTDQTAEKYVDIVTTTQTSCYHGNGTCLEGCDPGYWNHECKTRTFLLLSISKTHVCFL